MIREYRYKYDRTVWYITAIHFVVFGVLVWLSLLMFDGGYVTAWFVSLICAVIALMVLSIPRRVVLTESSVEIFCISDYTDIPYGEVVSVRSVGAAETRWFIPLFATFGFFGYYGYYLNLRKMEVVTVYSSCWKGMVEITDIYDDKYYISCEQAEEFVNLLRRQLGTGEEDMLQQTT